MQVRSLYRRIVHKQVERCTCIPSITPCGTDSVLYSQHCENKHTLAIMMSTGANDYTIHIQVFDGYGYGYIERTGTGFCYGIPQKVYCDTYRTPMFVVLTNKRQISTIRYVQIVCYLSID